MQKLQHIHQVKELGAYVIRELDGVVDGLYLTKGAIATIALIREVVSSMPLTTEEFGLTVNRLENAKRYFELGEIGAARFELGLVQQSLQISDS